jgi:hypothetical protein
MCKDGFDEYGYLYCKPYVLGVDFYFNKNNKRFLMNHIRGYYNVLPGMNNITDENSDTPVIEIGVCSPIQLSPSN